MSRCSRPARGADRLDTAIPFVPLFVVPYLSFFLLILLPLLVISDRRETADIAFGFGTIVAASSLTFLFWPTAIPFSESLADARRRRDGSDGNAFPSLHASLALYCALCARRKLQTGARAIRPVSVDEPRDGVGRCSSDVIWRSTLPGGAIARMGECVRGALPPERAEAPDSEPVVETLRIRTAPGARSVRRRLPPSRATTDASGRPRLVAFLALAGVGFWAEYPRPPVCSAPMLVAGILVTAVALNTFPLLMHEGMHGVLFANRRWNWIASVLPGSTFLMSFSAYQRAASPASSIPRRPARSRRLP